MSVTSYEIEADGENLRPVDMLIERTDDVDRRFVLNGVGHPSKIVAIVPAYNEERFIGSVVLKAALHAQTVIVVDDGSSDATADIALAAGAMVIRHSVNLGKGAALNTGFQHAQLLNPDAVVTLDADGQHVPEEIELVVSPVLSGISDIVVGSRYLEPHSDVPQHRVWGHRFFNTLNRGVSGLHVTDSQSGFRAFSPKALASLSFSSSSFSVESEMQLLAREHELRVSEVSITIHYLDAPKRSVIAQGLSVLHGIMRLTGQYRPLFFFGIPGLILLFVGVAAGIWVVDIYRSSHTLPIGYTVLSGMLTTVALLTLYTGVILHSVRGLLISIVHPRGE
jgi:glycosyltransferase involved in cell wall biosynthesis